MAGISTDWYTRIELGTAGAPSHATLQAIAHTLRLNPVETDYLFELAGLIRHQPQSGPGGPLSTTIEHVALNLKDAAVTVFDRYLTPRCWNATADAMYRWSARVDAFHRNAVVAGVTDPYYQEFHGAAFDDVARGVIGVFRRAFTTSTPTAFARRIFEFGMENPLFRSIWNESTVADHFTGSGPFLRYVPEVGELWVDYVDLVPAQYPEFSIRTLSPKDAQTQAKFARLATMGTERRLIVDA